MIEIQIMMLVKMVIELSLYGQERRRSTAHINGNNDKYSNRIDDNVSGNKTIDDRYVHCIHPSTGKRASSTRTYSNNAIDNSSKNGRFQRPVSELARRGKSYDNRTSNC